MITIDLPGHGQSEKPQTISYDKNLYTRAIDGVINDANAKSVILVGQTNGTPFIREYYRKFPRTVKALVIVEGPLRAFFNKETMEKFIAPMRGDNYPDAAGRVIEAMTSPITNARCGTRSER